MKFNKNWVKNTQPCREGLKWLLSQDTDDAVLIIERLISEKKFRWAEWAISKSLTKIQNVRWAVFSAEQVLPIFEKRYPNDLRPRKAIEAAKKYIEAPAYAYAYAYAAADAAAAARAAYAADAAADAYAAAAADAYAADAAYAYAAYAAADAAAYAAYAAAYAAYAAAYAADAAAYAADAAAYAADAAAYAADAAEMHVVCIRYGLTLLIASDSNQTNQKQGV
jgi:hypothetical protein